MVINKKDHKFFRFPQLAKELNVTQSRIQDDYLSGDICKFAIDLLNTPSNSGTKKRIAALMPILNKYARENLLDGPCNILRSAYFLKDLVVDNDKVNLLSNNVNSPFIFKMWLEAFGVNLDEIRIIIPLDEAIKYEHFLNEYYKNDQFDADKYIDERLSNSVKPQQIAIELVEKYGRKKEKYFGFIGRKLAGYDTSKFYSDATWRKRGERFYHYAKDEMEKMSQSHKTDNL